MLFRVLLILLVTFHIIIVFINLAAIFILPFYTPWYISVPLISFLIRLATVERECPLTALENLLRKQLGMRPINTFIGHYFVKHFRRSKK